MTLSTIRAATPGDAVGIAAIYSHFVRTSTATFEVDPPDAQEIARRIAAVHELGLPYLVAALDSRIVDSRIVDSRIVDSRIVDSRIVGYSYATQFRPRPAYRFTVEDSVYVDPAHAGHGIGRQLLTALIEASTQAGARQMIAGIGGDNPASVALHAALGFHPAGVLRAVGFKFDQWLDLTLMQLSL